MKTGKVEARMSPILTGLAELSVLQPSRLQHDVQYVILGNKKIELKNLVPQL